MSLEISIVPSLQPDVLPPARPPLWMHVEDQATGIWRNDDGDPILRPCAYQGGCPAVFVLSESNPKTILTRDLMFYIAAINYNMVPEDVSTEFDYKLAFCNTTGLTRPDIPRNDYLKGVTGVEDAKFDKDRTCARSAMTGTVGYSLMQAIQQAFAAVRTEKTFLAVRQALVSNNVLVVTTLDGNKPPPLKPGKSYPARVQDIDPDIYLYTPWTHRWLFFAANTVGTASGGGSKIYPFPRGATYSWTGDGWRYTWMPHISRGPIKYPLSRLRKLGATEPIPSPYRTA